MTTSSKQQSIAAYENAERVRRYGVDMDLMHPNRSKMATVAIEVLTAAGLPAEPTIIDLGIGTGFFSWQFLHSYPNAHIIGIDGSQPMLDLASTRLGPLAENVSLRQADFREVESVIAPSEKADAALASFALHHLNTNEKIAALQKVRQHLKPGGWFVDADIVVGDDVAEKLVQDLRVQGIVRRAAAVKDPRFKDFATTRQWLDKLEAEDNDQPLTLAQELDIFAKARFSHVTVFWFEYREIVIGGRNG